MNTDVSGKINELVEISRYYGIQKEYTLGGGGNTSWKNEEHLYVKASGFPLAEIEPHGFAVLDRKKMQELKDKKYSRNVLEREQQVKEDLMSCLVDPGQNLRPSVEASLHEIINYAFIVHTHPFLINALLCSRNARELAMEWFGENSIFVPYTDPGYLLFKKVDNELKNYREKKGMDPAIIFLQNHGVFVGSNSPAGINEGYDRIISRLKEQVITIIKTQKMDFLYPHLNLIQHIYSEISEDGFELQSRNNTLIEHFASGKRKMKILSGSFIPDHVVYFKKLPLFLYNNEKSDGELIRQKIMDYKKTNGYLPRIFLIEKEGIIGLEKNQKSVELVLDVFEDAMKIAYYAEYFGGPHYMTSRQVEFIENWEVENYRRNLLIK